MFKVSLSQPFLKLRPWLRCFLAAFLMLTAALLTNVSYAQAGTVSISGTVRYDANNDGLLNSGDTVRSGVTVILFDDNMQSISATTSSSTGTFLFSNLAPGYYRLQSEEAWDVFPGNNATKIDYKTIRVAATTGGTAYTNNVFLITGPCECNNPPVDICGRVMVEKDCDGTLDGSEVSLGNVTITLRDSSNTVVATTKTDSSGSYCFTNLVAGTYTVRESVPSAKGYTATNAFPGNSSTKINNANIKVKATTPGGHYYDNDFLLCQPPSTPDVKLTKLANVTSIKAGGKVTYTYTITNTGDVQLLNLVVRDDNGTPTVASDDFTVGTIASLNPGQSTKLTATVIPPYEYCNGTDHTHTGTVIAKILPNGNIQAMFIQDFGVNDNTYGVNSIGWGNKIHKFGDLVGSDQATWQFTDAAGKAVLSFKEDYISKATQAVFPSGTVSYPSGYGTLGVTGGEGKMIAGSASNVLSATTSLTDNLNQSPAYYGIIVDSPAQGSTLAAKWNYLNSYTVVVSKAAFGSAGFGRVEILSQHNSPAKISNFTPEICTSSVTNTAVVTGKDAAGHTVTSSAQATVSITTS